MNGLNSFNKTNREYSLHPTDYLIGFWRSKIKVTAGLSNKDTVFNARKYDHVSSAS